jgi:hypothetical protein
VTDDLEVPALASIGNAGKVSVTIGDVQTKDLKNTCSCAVKFFSPAYEQAGLKLLKQVGEG